MRRRVISYLHMDNSRVAKLNLAYSIAGTASYIGALILLYPILKNSKDKRLWAGVILLAVSGIALTSKINSASPPKSSLPEDKNDSHATSFDGYYDGDYNNVKSTLDFPDLANRIFEAENGCNAYEDTVMECFSKISSNTEYSQLVDAFGIKVCSKCWATHPIDALTDKSEMRMGLDEFLNFNLSQEALDKIVDMKDNWA